MNLKFESLKKMLLALIVVTSSGTTLFAQWANVGLPTFNTDKSGPPSFSFDSNDIPYVAFEDGNFEAGPGGGNLSVMKFDGVAWVNVGLARFSPDRALSPSLDIDSQNIPYVAFANDANGRKAMVMKYNGTSWENVGIDGFSADDASWIDLAIDNDDTPYVAYRDSGNSGKTTVMKYNGTAWENVGIAGFSADVGQYQSLRFDSNDIPYVAYSDSNQGGKATVMKYNGTAWENVGIDGFSVGSTAGQSLAFDNNDMLYVAFSDSNSGGKTTVMKYNGIIWENVGIAGISVGNTFTHSLTFDSCSIPYVAFSDQGNGGKATVMKFNGTAWVAVGVSGFSAGSTEAPSLAIESNDNPYVAFRDGTDENKTTVMNNITAKPETANNSKSVLPNNILTLKTSDFVFTGILPADILDHIELVSIPSGALFIDADDSGLMDNGETALMMGTTVSKVILDADQLKFIASDSDTDFKFKVSDGTIESSAKKMSVNLIPLTVTVSSISRQAPVSSNTNADEVTFRAIFDENVLNVDIADFLLSGSVAGDGAINSVTAVDGKTYDVNVVGLISSNGTINLNIRGNGGTAGANDILADNVVDGGLRTEAPTVDEAYTIDNTSSIVNSYTPENGANDIAVADNLTITFNESIVEGTGSIVIKDASDDSTVEIIDVVSGAVTVNATTVTINPTTDFPKNKSYYIQIDNTAFRDLANNNYVGISDKTTWSFNTLPKTTPSITFIDLTKIYGDIDFDLGATSSSTGIITYSIIGAGNGTVISDETVTIGAAGSVTIRASVTEDADYAVSSKDITLTINQKVITITTDVQSKEYGAVDPDLTYQLTSGSFESGDVLTGSLLRTAGEDVGTYSINQGSLTAGDNYDLTFVSNDLTIATKALTITADAQSKEYGTIDPDLTYQMTSGNLVGGDVLTGSLSRASGEDVGTYSINQGSLIAGVNYDLTFIEASLEIVATEATITTTTTASNITGTSAILGGEVISNGGTIITERGIVWSTHPNPSILDNKLIDESTSDNVFNITINDLTPNTTIYYSSYAINNVGIVYGDIKDFKTSQEEIGSIERDRYGFSPNGDGINDIWLVNNIENYPNNIARVYNRSGKLVFEQSSYNNTWDGHSSQVSGSGKLPSGAYYFTISFNSSSMAPVAGWLYINY